MNLVLLVALPFIGSVIAALFPTNARNAESTWAGLVALICLLQVALLFPSVSNGGVIRQDIAWLPGAGLDLVIRMDGLAWMLAMLVTGIGALVVLYARYYMSPADPVPRFFSFLLAFMGAMMGLVLSGNLIQLVFFWELTSLFSFLLIGYWHHRADARRGARMALVVTGAGGLCLLAGVLLLGHTVGGYDLDVVLASGDAVRAHPLYKVMLVLVLLGAFTKSAQFPFHFWLPRAMAAPTPVSAYLHSATMVKAGVFLLARLWPVLAGTEEWFWIVGSVGLCTLLLGAYLAIFQNDLKRLLAYSTISHLGLITLLLGLNSPLAAVAAVFHIMNHATFKASLFMAAGNIDHETGTRDIRRLDGLFKVMPITGTLAMVASAAMAGVPLLNGFLSKEMFFAETVYISSLPWVEFGLPVAATLAGIFAVIYALRFSYDIFFGPLSTDLPREPHEPPIWMRVPVDLLVLTCLVVGIFPEISIGWALRAAATPVVGGVLPEYSLAVWHGFNAPMMMSLIAIGGGIVGYLLFRKQLERGRFERAPLIGRLDGERLFERALSGSSSLARRGARDLRHAAAAVAIVPRGKHGCAGRGDRAMGARPGLGRAAADPHVAGICDTVAGRNGGRGGRRVASEISPPGRVDDDGSRRPRHLPHLRVVLGARSRADPACGRGRHHRAVPARLALAAKAHSGRSADHEHDTGAPFTRLGARAVQRRWNGGACLCNAHAAVSAKHLALFSDAHAARGWRHQCGQRDPGRLPQLRYDGRDHRVGRGGADRVCLAAAFQAAAREYRDTGSTAGAATRSRYRFDPSTHRA